MRRRLMNGCLAAVTCFAICRGATADEVQFKNGDHLTGTIETLEAGKLTIKSAVAGKVTVKLSDVKTFSTDGPIELRLTDGTILHQKLNADADGQVSIGPGGAVAPQSVPLTAIKFINPPFEKWTGSIAAGGSLARGNTNTESLNASANLVRRGEKDRITVDAGYLWSREHVPGFAGKHETANDWFIAPKYDYFFTEKLYGYANARIERDLIADLSLLFTPGAGAGYQWVEQPNLHFNTEGGVSWLYRDFRNDGTNESIAARLAYHFDAKLSDKLSFIHNVEYYPGLDRIDNYFFDADAGVRATITDRMFTELKIQYKYNSEPAPGKEHSDTRLLLGVGWAF
jgi:putative salt-induced outer membrane protein YdiY